jgi:hypothetical protein
MLEITINSGVNFSSFLLSCHLLLDGFSTVLLASLVDGYLHFAQIPIMSAM